MSSFLKNILGVETLKVSNVPNVENFKSVTGSLCTEIYNYLSRNVKPLGDISESGAIILKDRAENMAFDILKDLRDGNEHYANTINKLVRTIDEGSELKKKFDDIFFAQFAKPGLYGVGFTGHDRFKNDLDLFIKLNRGVASVFSRG